MGVTLMKVSGTVEEINYPWKEVEQARSQDEYLLERGRSNVSWVGDVHELGFEGEPTAEAAMLLLNGKTGDGELRLREATVQALHLQFNMPKDLSGLHAIGTP